MKSNSKKIIAGVGMGLMLGTGAMFATGCSQVPITQEQLDKIMTVVDNSDVFMSESLDLLKESNNKLDRSVAVRLYNYALTRLYTNRDEVLNNMSMRVVGETYELDMGLDSTYYFYKIGNKRLCAFVGKQYKISDGLYQEIGDYYDDETINTYKETAQILDHNKYKTTFAGRVMYDLNYWNSFTGGDVTEENVVDCTVLENGNYLITVVKDLVVDSHGEQMLDYPMVLDCEITPDGFLVSKMFNMIEDAHEYCYTYGKIEFEYNKLTQEQVQTAKAKAISLSK